VTVFLRFFTSVLVATSTDKAHTHTHVTRDQCSFKTVAS